MIRAFYPKEGKLLHLDRESLVSIICSKAEALQFSHYPKLVAIRETGEEENAITSTYVTLLKFNLICSSDNL